MITPGFKKQFRLFRVAEATWWKRVPRVMFLQLCELYFFLFFTPFPSYSCSIPSYGFLSFLCTSSSLIRCIAYLFLCVSSSLYYFNVLVPLSHMLSISLSLSFDSSFHGSRNQSQIWWFSHFGDGHQSMNGYLCICIPMTRIPIISFYGMVDHRTCTVFWPWHMCVYIHIYIEIVH
jgi:hypothetical protein